MSEKKKRGRPTKMTEETLGKLELAFSKGLTDNQACVYADINPDTLYNYCKKHPEFSERKELLKDTPILNAKINVAEGIKSGDIDLSKWYLERKAKDEFSHKQDIDLNAELKVPIFVGESEFENEE